MIALSLVKNLGHAVSGQEERAGLLKKKTENLEFCIFYYLSRTKSNYEFGKSSKISNITYAVKGISRFGLDTVVNLKIDGGNCSFADMPIKFTKTKIAKF